MCGQPSPGQQWHSQPTPHPTRNPCRYEFTLHGMWPQRRDGTWPEFCDPSSHIDMDALDDLVEEMEHDWPSWSSTDEVGCAVPAQLWLMRMPLKAAARGCRCAGSC